VPVQLNAPRCIGSTGFSDERKKNPKGLPSRRNTTSSITWLICTRVTTGDHSNRGIEKLLDDVSANPPMTRLKENTTECKIDIIVCKRGEKVGLEKKRFSDPNSVAKRRLGLIRSVSKRRILGAPFCLSQGGEPQGGAVSRGRTELFHTWGHPKDQGGPFPSVGGFSRRHFTDPSARAARRQDSCTGGLSRVGSRGVRENRRLLSEEKEKKKNGKSAYTSDSSGPGRQNLSGKADMTPVSTLDIFSTRFWKERNTKT